VLRLKALSQGDPWTANAALAAGDAQAFVNGEEVMAMEVPYFFTMEGHEKAYQVGLTTVAADFQKELWVMGQDANAEGMRMQMSQIRPNVARLYARDYIDAWEKVITTPKPANYFADAAALGAFTKQPSPLKVLMLELRKHTNFKGGTGAAKDIAMQRLEASRIGRAVRAGQKVAGEGGFDAGTEIANYFKPIHDFVGDGKQPGPIDEFVAAVKEAGAAVTSANIAGGGIGGDTAQGAMAMAMGKVAAAAGGAPPQLKAFVEQAASGGAKASVSAAQGALGDAWTNSVLPDCKLATEDKYPFFGTAEADASLVDVQQVFAMGGSLDAFLTQRIMPLLDMSGPIWRWNDSPATANLSPSSPDEFAKARKLRDMLVAGIAVKFEPKSFGADVDIVDLATGGTQYRFERSGSGDRPVIWSAQGNVPEASITFLKNGAEGQKPAEVEKVRKSGPWALFRLMDTAKFENTGPDTVTATFGKGTKSAVFKITLPGKQNPFIRGGGVWSFRCPVVL